MYGVTGATGLIKRGQLVPFNWLFVFQKIKGECTMVRIQKSLSRLVQVYGDENL